LRQALGRRVPAPGPLRELDQRHRGLRDRALEERRGVPQAPGAVAAIMTANKPIRVLVVEDSAFNRRALAEMLAAAPDVQVVAKASDGEEGLKLALVEHPDAITLDLALPGLDGFGFLRLLMAQLPTPVIVISAYSRQEDV